MTNRFFIAHLFFLVAFLALVCAAGAVVIRRRREWKPMVLALLPLALIFVTAYLGKHAPTSHQAMNVFCDGLLVYNTYYFWKALEILTFWFYLSAVIATALDFAMHFAIRTM